jgi:coenzyme PQQ precursor peptide PqqA
MGLHHFARWLCRQDRVQRKSAGNRGVAPAGAAFDKPLGEGLALPGRMAQAIARRNTMVWKAPRIVEIAIGMEINTYACAEIA